MVAYQYDVIIIGAGPGGLAAAYRLSSSKRVLIIEQHLWGGTCPNYGCDPKKILYGVIESKRQAVRFQHHGLTHADTISVDWPTMMNHKKEYTDRIPGGTESGLTSAHIDHVHGTCHFLDAHTISVNDQHYSAANFIIATGAQATIPSIKGSEYLQTSTDFLALPQLPAKIGFIGAGYVALELANIAVSAGAEVHIFQHNHRVLRNFPQSETEQVTKLLVQKGVQFHFDTTIETIQRRTTNIIATTTTGSQYSVDALFAASGRRANTDGLNLDVLSIEHRPQGIAVNEFLQTTQPNIYAIGDVADKELPKLTPVASFEGRYVADHLLSVGNLAAPIHYPAIPHTVFVGPELSEVGVSLSDAQSHPERFKIKAQSVGSWYTYHRILDKTAKVTTIIDRQTRTLVGGTVLATNAEELINYLTIMIQNHTTSDDLEHFIPVYPSVASDLSYLI